MRYNNYIIIYIWCIKGPETGPFSYFVNHFEKFINIYNYNLGFILIELINYKPLSSFNIIIYSGNIFSKKTGNKYV